MKKHFIKLALRNLVKYKINTIINIVGLSISFAALMMITIYVLYENSYDEYHANKERIFKVEIERKLANKRDFTSAGPYPLAKKLVANYPEIIDVFRVKNANISLKYKEQKLENINTIFTEQSIFNVLTIPFVQGNINTVLKSSDEVIITESYAHKLFGDADPMNKQLEFNNRSLNVTAVIEDFPSNSHIKPDVILHLDVECNPQYFEKDWGNNFLETYVLLDEHVNWKLTETKIHNTLNEHRVNAERFLYLNKLTNVHLHPTKQTDRSQIVKVLGISGFLILIIALVNYINLNTAANLDRKKEISVKKLVGDNRISLIWQMAYESLFIVFIAFDISLVFVEKTLAGFSQLIGSKLELSDFRNVWFIGASFIFIMILGWFSGIISGLKVSGTHILRKQDIKPDNASKIDFKKFLLGIQFVISLVMIILTLSTYNQFNYLKKRKLGFDKDNLIYTQVIRYNADINKLNTLKEEITKISGVKSCSYSYNIPFLSSNGWYITKRKNDQEEIYKFQMNYIDNDFINTYDIEVIEDSGFEEVYSETGRLYCMINESGANVLGWDNPVGKIIYHNNIPCTIIGVVQDFHLWEINWKIPPMLLVEMPSDNNFLYKYLALNTTGINHENIRLKATEKLKEIFPDISNEFASMSNNNLNNEIYDKAKGVGRSLAIFSLLAIFISCLGVFGFVNISLKQRTKELGIRKAIGSSVIQIFGLIFKDFLLLIFISSLLAIPISWYFTKAIFQQYAYTTSVRLETYVLSFGVLMLFTFISVFYHTIKTAKANPVEALRYE